jgi:hypothetical protein
MKTSEAITNKVPIDALIVLGRGIDGSGELTADSLRRSQVAVHIGELLGPRVVVFSGGRSWRQVEQGEQPPISEGEAMLERAQRYAIRKRNQPLPDKIEWLSENESTNTTENFAYSSDLINLRPREILAYLTDDLHDLYQRAFFLSNLVYPGHEIVPITIPTIFTHNQKDEERLSNIATRFFMFGVRPGNIDAIMRRQRVLESANRLYRKIGSRTIKLTLDRPTSQPNQESI